MYARSKSFTATALCLLLAVPFLPAAAQEDNSRVAREPAGPATTDHIIVRWKNGVSATATTRAQKLSAASGLAIVSRKSIDSDTEVIQLPQRLSDDALTATLQQVQSDPDVMYASPDLRRHIHALTNDPLLSAQWYLADAQPSATRAETAWDITTGSPTVVVAVLDTGARFDHPDLGRVAAGGKLLDGYDFVSNPLYSNDGDARDSDPTDPGDWVDSTDRAKPGFDSDCDLSGSSWHGTRVSGLIGAMTNNAVGVAGAAFNTRILPVRVLGKCGGTDSDIIAAMRWAAGLSVAGVPDNPTPASVINLSLGGTGPCTSAYQDVVNAVTARGVLIVASAGNEGGLVSAPANCTGVVGVAGIRHIGTKVGFSNLGTELSIGAPGGNCVNTGPGQPCLFSIVVAINSGTTVPAASTYTDEINANYGTSFSAPQVAATAALMRSINDRLTPAQVTTLMKQSAGAFPVNSAVPTCHVPTGGTDIQNTECSCTTTTCGAGMLNTGAAVAAAQRPLAILQTSGSVSIGATITIDGSTSFAANDRTLTAYQWSVSDVTGTAPTITSPTQAMTTLQIPGATQFTLHLAVTDDQGAQGTQLLSLATPATAPPTTTPAAPRGGGGGGSFALELLAMVALLGYRRLSGGTSEGSPPRP
ncbi:MAG TPA: S8 family serine peptidase [Povalibacter sp.]|nr:S8 family serine peptidase [Povalibacter sp.]